MLTMLVYCGAASGDNCSMTDMARAGAPGFVMVKGLWAAGASVQPTTHVTVVPGAVACRLQDATRSLRYRV